MRKSVIGMLFMVSLVLLVLMFSVSASSDLSCEIKSTGASDYDPNNVIMGVSDMTNAHGELKSEGSYAYVIQCTFAASTTCTGNNEIINLSSSTNAHAELPAEGNYNVPVCYENLDCTISPDSNAPIGFPIPILSLSSTTNAHIGNVGDYETNIFCRSPTLPISFWSVNGVSSTSQIDVVPDVTEVQMIFENSGLDENTEVTFKIIEDDSGEALNGGDDLIKTLTATPDENGDFLVDWEITQGDLDRGTNEFAFIVEDEDNLRFFFEAYDNVNNLLVTSGNLGITVLSTNFCDDRFVCGDYLEANCDSSNDPCNLAKNNPAADCSDPLINCFCDFNSTANSCNDIFEVIIINDEGFKEVLGQCIIDADEGNDNCDDGFITYSWTASWDGVGDAPDSCQSGQQTLQCPAKIQLPFFGFYNFIVTMFAIALVYGFMILRKRKN